jgi:hypothetical protein
LLRQSYEARQWVKAQEYLGGVKGRELNRKKIGSLNRIGGSRPVMRQVDHHRRADTSEYNI